MDARRQVAVFDDARQQACKLFALIASQRSTDDALMLPGDLEHLLAHTFALPCEMEGIQSAVPIAAASLHESTMLQLVEQLHEPAGMHLQYAGELLLADSRRAVEHPNDSGVWRPKVERSQQASENLC